MSTSLVAKIPGSVLDKIADQRRLDVTAAQAVVTEDELRAQIAAQSPAGVAPNSVSRPAYSRPTCVGVST